jgi:hypothetical protein
MAMYLLQTAKQEQYTIPAKSDLYRCLFHPKRLFTPMDWRFRLMAKDFM